MMCRFNGVIWRYYETRECDSAGRWVMMMCRRRLMEFGPMGLRQGKSREGFPSLNIRTGLSSWIRHWTQHSYTQNSQYLPYHVFLFYSLSYRLPRWLRHLWWFDSPIRYVKEGRRLLGSIQGRFDWLRLTLLIKSFPDKALGYQDWFGRLVATRVGWSWTSRQYLV